MLLNQRLRFVLYLGFFLELLEARGIHRRQVVETRNESDEGNVTKSGSVTFQKINETLDTLDFENIIPEDVVSLSKENHEIKIDDHEETKLKEVDLQEIGTTDDPENVEEITVFKNNSEILQKENSISYWDATASSTETFTEITLATDFTTESDTTTIKSQILKTDEPPILNVFEKEIVQDLVNSMDELIDTTWSTEELLDSTTTTETSTPSETITQFTSDEFMITEKEFTTDGINSDEPTEKQQMNTTDKPEPDAISSTLDQDIKDDGIDDKTVPYEIFYFETKTSPSDTTLETTLRSTETEKYLEQTVTQTVFDNSPTKSNDYTSTSEGNFEISTISPEVFTNTDDNSSEDLTKNLLETTTFYNDALFTEDVMRGTTTNSQWEDTEIATSDNISNTEPNQLFDNVTQEENPPDTTQTPIQVVTDFSTEKISLNNKSTTIALLTETEKPTEEQPHEITNTPKPSILNSTCPPTSSTPPPSGLYLKPLNFTKYNQTETLTGSGYLLVSKNITDFMSFWKLYNLPTNNTISKIFDRAKNIIAQHHKNIESFNTNFLSHRMPPTKLWPLNDLIGAIPVNQGIFEDLKRINQMSTSPNPSYVFAPLTRPYQVSSMKKQKKFQQQQHYQRQQYPQQQQYYQHQHYPQQQQHYQPQHHHQQQQQQQHQYGYQHTKLCVRHHQKLSKPSYAAESKFYPNHYNLNTPAGTSSYSSPQGPQLISNNFNRQKSPAMFEVQARQPLRSSINNNFPILLI